MSWFRKIRYWWAERELRNPNNWDLEHAQKIEPAPRDKRRTIVSVAFTREQFYEVCKRAESAGKKTSTFIREQALATALNTTSVDASETTWLISATGKVRLADATG